MIRIYGKLARQFKKRYGTDPRAIPIRVESASEMMRALDANFPGFRRLLNRSGYYRVTSDDKVVPESEVEMNFLGSREWSIMPAAAGSKEGGVLQTIAGAVLIVVGVVASAYGYGAIGSPLIKMGAAMMIGGVGQMLTGTPDMGDPGANEAQDERRSFLFSGPTNVVEPGTTIPLVYGEIFVGSIAVSGGEIIEEY